jgi:AcrR family transcriptional regulator
MTTAKRLIAAASALLDAGGEEAVTLRAVGHAVGVSHNAPYKHFKDRSALLAAVAMVDFKMLAEAFIGIRQSSSKPTSKLKRALRRMIDYGREHPARYRLLFSNPDIAALGGEIEQAALMAFAEFAAIVQECQSARELPDVSNTSLSGLLYAAMHGLIDLDASGRMRPAKGLSNVGQSLDLLIRLLSQKG